MTAPDRSALLAVYREGVDAFARLAARTADAGAWHHVACGTWTAADVARHELDVVGWYHGWLDRALAGDASPAFDIAVIDEITAAGVDALAAVPPAEAVERFVGEASRYAERLEPNWDLPFGYPRGTVTAGLHAGLAASEWHLHTWDLARALGEDHRPGDPGTVLAGALACMRAVGQTVPDLPADADPWPLVLAGSGRAG